MKAKQFGILIVGLSLSLVIFYAVSEKLFIYLEINGLKPHQGSFKFPYSAHSCNFPNGSKDIHHRMAARRVFLQKKCTAFGLDVPGNDTLHKPSSWEYLINKKYHIIWCNIFKAASSTWMYNFNILAGYPADFLNKTHVVPLTLARRIYHRVSLEKLLMAQNTSLTFMIVRHPFERLLSVHMDKFMFAPPKAFYSKLNKEIIKNYRLNKKDLQAPKYATFSEFVRWHLDQIQANNSIDMHLVPATTFCTPCLINIDIIMKFETLQEDQRYFVKKAKLPDTLATNWKNKGKGSNASDIVGTYYSQLTREQLRRLYEYYKYDFKLFGYSATQYFGSVKADDQSGQRIV